METKTELLAIRQLLYSFLGSSFLYLPNAHQIKTILHDSLFDELPLVIAGEDFQQGLSLLQTWTKESESRAFKEILAELRQDYTAMFIGPGHLLAAPWESVYLTEERLTFGEPTLAVREFYLRHGLEFAKKNSEPDDHFGLEMEFMSKLIAGQIQNLAEGLQEEAAFFESEQLVFLQEHLLKWTDDFTDNILNNARTLYFQGLARFTKGYVAWDGDYLRHEHFSRSASKT